MNQADGKVRQLQIKSSDYVLIFIQIIKMKWFKKYIAKQTNTIMVMFAKGLEAIK